MKMEGRRRSGGRRRRRVGRSRKRRRRYGLGRCSHETEKHKNLESQSMEVCLSKIQC